MFNYAGTTTNFRPSRALGGLSRSETDSFRTLFCGPDPADNNRLLIRKIVQLNDKTYAYEETRINRNNHDGHPSVHTTMYKIAGFDLKEHITPKEWTIRALHRPMPNILGYSLYYRKTHAGLNHLSIVENSLWKTSGSTWSEWW